MSNSVANLVEEKLIDQEAIFIDGTKIEANANKFTFVWKKSIEKYHQSLIEKSNQLYNELLENEIIPEIERESDEDIITGRTHSNGSKSR